MATLGRLARGAAVASIAAAAVAAACRGEASGDPEGEPAEAPVATATLVRAYPHDSTAFTQGLLFHGGYLYESTGRYGDSSLRQVRLETGEVLRRVAVEPRHFAEGLALHQGRLYQLTWQDGMGFVYDLESLARQDTFPYTGEGWGLTGDGRSLVMSDGSNQLRFLDPATFAVTRTLDVLDGDRYVHQLNELEWVRGEIWANVWHDERIARIDPRTGSVIGWIDISALHPPATRRDREAVPNGIAFDDATGRIFVTGKLWPAVYEIRVEGIVGG